MRTEAPYGDFLFIGDSDVASTAKTARFFFIVPSINLVSNDPRLRLQSRVPRRILGPGKYHDPGLLRSYQLNAENCHHFKNHLLYSQLLELKDCITTILSRLKRTVLKYLHVIDVATVTVAAQCFGIQVCTVQYASDGTSMMVYCFSLINLRSLLNCLNMLLHNLRS